MACGLDIYNEYKLPVQYRVLTHVLILLFTLLNTIDSIMFEFGPLYKTYTLTLLIVFISTIATREFIMLVSTLNMYAFFVSICILLVSVH